MFRNILENSEEDQDVLDRAGYYYNMLKEDMNQLRQIFEEMRYARIEENGVIEIESANFEFNSLSVIYNKPADAFIKSYEFLKKQRNRDDSDYEDDEESEDETETTEAPVDNTEETQATTEPASTNILEDGEEAEETEDTEAESGGDELGTLPFLKQISNLSRTCQLPGPRILP